MSIRIHVGDQVVTSSPMTNDKGMVEWLQRMPEMAVKLPLDPDQIPDTFIYLIPERSRKPICYCRLDTRKDIVEKGLDQPPKWYPLKEDPSIDALDSATFPGTVLLSIGLAPKDPPHEQQGQQGGQGRQGGYIKPITQDVTPLYAGLRTDRNTDWCAMLDRSTARRGHLRVHLYSGRELPAADSNGLVDPYCILLFMGQKVKSKLLKKTRDPIYSQSFVFDVLLPGRPGMLAMAPDVTVQIWDYDKFDRNDYVGMVRVPIVDACERSTDTPEGEGG